MHFGSWGVRIAAGALIAAALATSAPAATYLFNVQVTGSSGFFGPPAPLEFLQTWTLEPEHSGTNISGGGISLRFERANGTTDRTSTILDGAVRSAAGGLALPDASFNALKSQSTFFSNPTVSSYQINFEASANRTTGSPAIPTVNTTSLTMSATGSAPNNFDPLDQYGVRDLLLYAGPLQWRMSGGQEFYSGGRLLFSNQLAYSGVATLVGFTPTPIVPPPPPPPPMPSAAPEPATWALLLAGFGLAGAHLRRRAARIRPA